jgi:hypothetical protein
LLKAWTLESTWRALRGIKSCTEPQDERLPCRRAQVNQRISKSAHIKELNAEMAALKAELYATRERNGVYMPADLFAAREQARALPWKNIINII